MLSKRILLAGAFLLNCVFAFAQKPVLNLTTIAYVEQQTADYYGGQQAIQDSIRLQFQQINANYNADSRFAHTYNFNVPAFHFYTNNNPNFDSSYYYRYTKPAETNYRYRIVYDQFSKKDSTTTFNYTQTVNFFYSQKGAKLGNMFAKLPTKILTHEFGHSRAQLDLYATNVNAGSNPVNQNYIYVSDYSSIMNDLYNESQWDPITIAILNKSGQLYGSGVVPNDQIAPIQRSFFPQNMYITVKDANGNPLSNAQVQMYGVKFYQNTVDGSAPVISRATDANGKVSFVGAANNPFNPSAEPQWLSLYANFFVKVTYGGQTRYSWFNSVEALNVVTTGGTDYNVDVKFPAGSTQPANIPPTSEFGIAGGQVLTANNPYYLIINARDIDGDPSLLTVKFYQGSTYLGLGTWEPGALRYSYTLNAGASGEYSYNAIVTDPNGATSTSIASKIRIYGTEAITLNISSPANNTSVSAGTVVSLKTKFSDLAGTVYKIEYYDGATLIGTSTNIPYSFNWTPATAGNHSITAKVYDSFGMTKTSAAITVVVTAPVGCPDPQYVAGTTYATGAKVQNNGHEYQCTVGGWCSSAAASFYAPGTGSAWTSAWTDLGACGGTNAAPTVNLTSPTVLTYTAPATVSIAANATDADGTISKVDFYQGSTLLYSDATSPYAYSWTGVAAGTYAITAKATDNQNAVTTSTAVNITVNAASNTAPTVSLTAPTVLTYTAPATVSITANAADADGTISKVDFYQGTTLLYSDVTSPYAYSWTGVAAGTYAITAKATDNQNAVTTSAVVNITVNAVSNTAPTVSLTAPTVLTYTAPATVSIAANAADADGTISKVDFYQGTTLLYSDVTSPYSYSWTGVAAGTYAITAKAYDNNNAVTTSSAVTITVNATGGTCTAPVWSASTVYSTGGIAVQYNGIKYVSNYWTQGNQPDLNNGGAGSGKPWTSQGTCTSRVETLTATETVVIYPNPSNGNFTIVSQACGNAVVVSTFGDVVASFILTEGLNTVSLPLASGIYFLKTENQVTKLVIE